MIDSANIMNKPFLVVDVSPLWELEYTGIPNVVYELTRKFAQDSILPFDVRFSVFMKLIDNRIIQTCLEDRSGAKLRTAYEASEGVHEIIVDENGYMEGRLSFSLYLHRKPNNRIFFRESRLFYDFSFLLTPECHTRENIDYLANGLAEQIDTTDLFFSISESTANDLKWLFNISDEKSIVALLGHNVEDSLAQQARDHIGSSCIEPYFLMVGTIEPRKNIAIIFEWLKTYPGLLEQFKFVFAGRQGWGPSFEEYIERYNLNESFASGRIVYFGYVDEALKATLMVGAAGVFYPSLFEGFGLPVLEAMELGVPVIASCSTSIPEVLGDTGYYFDPYSVESLNCAFSQFLFDQCSGQKAKRIKMARERAATFSYDRMYEIIRQGLIANFLSGSGANENLFLGNELVLNDISEADVELGRKNELNINHYPNSVARFLSEDLAVRPNKESDTENKTKSKVETFTKNISNKKNNNRKKTKRR